MSQFRLKRCTKTRPTIHEDVQYFLMLLVAFNYQKSDFEKQLLALVIFRYASLLYLTLCAIQVKDDAQINEFLDSIEAARTVSALVSTL